jgi:HD-GYP domain-containing protein (c-di-GMP phosphodiesterase class II)
MENQEVIDSLRSLHDLSKAINSTLDINEVVEMIMEKTAVLMKSEKVLLLLLNKADGSLEKYSSRGFGTEELPIERFKNVQNFDHCIVHKGTVISLAEIVLKDEYKELTNKIPLLSSMVFAPLEIKGEAYGLIGVKDSERDFSLMELEIFCSLGSQAAVAMENANLYKRLKDSFFHTAEALAEAINSRDPYTGGHTGRVRDYAVIIATALNLGEEELESLKFAATLHDIGKIGIDDAILRKRGILSVSEEAAMRKHPEIGARILGHVEEMGASIEGVRHHHERVDGRGYPDGLTGDKIPLQARIIAVADAFDALTTDRPYKKAVDKATASKELKKTAGTHFDPRLVDILCKGL